MIPLKFYRDDNYVYYNNPNGITKKMSIADFEAVFNTDASELPTYTSLDAGKILTVNSGGTGLEWGESSSGAPFVVECEVVVDTVHNATTYTLNKTWKEIHDAFLNGSVIVNEEGYYSTVLLCYESEGSFYGVMYSSQLDNRLLETNSEQGYPTFLAT